MKKLNLNILKHTNCEYTLVFEELLGYTSARACPSQVYHDWATLAITLREGGIKEERIAKAKQSLDISPDREVTIESANWPI